MSIQHRWLVGMGEWTGVVQHGQCGAFSLPGLLSWFAGGENRVEWVGHNRADAVYNAHGMPSTQHGDE